MAKVGVPAHASRWGIGREVGNNKPGAHYFLPPKTQDADAIIRQQTAGKCNGEAMH